MSEPRSLQPRELSVGPDSSGNEAKDSDHTQLKISTSLSPASMDDTNAQNSLTVMTLSPVIVQASVWPDKNEDRAQAATGVHAAGEIQPGLDQSPTSSQLFSMIQESDLNTMKETLKRDADEIRSLEQQNKTLSATIIAKDTEREKEKQCYADFTDRLLRQILQHEEQWSQDDIAKGKLEDAARQHRIDFNKAKAQIREYQRKEPERQQEIEKLNKEKEGLRRDIASLKDEIRVLERKASIASAETAESHARIADAAAANERLNASIKDKTLQMVALYERIAELTTSRSKIEQVLTNLTSMEERSRQIDLAWLQKFDSLALPSVDIPSPLTAAYHTENESLEEAFINLSRKVRSNSAPSSANAKGSHAPLRRSCSFPDKLAKPGGYYLFGQETPESYHFNIQPRDSHAAESDLIQAATSQCDQDAMIGVDFSERASYDKEYSNDRKEKSLLMELEELGEAGEDYSSEIYLEALVPSRMSSDTSDQQPLSLPVGDQPSVLRHESHIDFAQPDNGAEVVYPGETPIRKTAVSTDADSHILSDCAESGSVDMDATSQPPPASEDSVSWCLENAKQTIPGLHQQIPLEPPRLFFDRVREKCASLLPLDLATDGLFHNGKASSRSNSIILRADTPRVVTFSSTNLALPDSLQWSLRKSEVFSLVSDSDEDVQAHRKPGKEDSPEIDARHEVSMSRGFKNQYPETSQADDDWNNPWDNINLTNNELTSTQGLGWDEEPARSPTTLQTPDLEPLFGQRYEFECAPFGLTAPSAGNTHPDAISESEHLLTVPETVRVAMQQADNTSDLFERLTELADRPATAVTPDQGAEEARVATSALQEPLHFTQILPQDDVSRLLMPELLRSLETADDPSSIRPQEGSASLISGPHRRQLIIKMFEDTAGYETLSIAGASTLQNLALSAGSTSENAARGERDESPPTNEAITSDDEGSFVRSEPHHRRRTSYDQCTASLARRSSNLVDAPPPTTIPLKYDWAEAATPWAMVSASSEQPHAEAVVKQPLGPSNLAGALRWHVKSFVASRTNPRRWQMILHPRNPTRPLASEPVAPERLPVNDGHPVLQVEELQDEQSVIDTQQSTDREVQMTETLADGQAHVHEAGAQRAERQTAVATHRHQAGAGFVMGNMLFDMLTRSAEWGYRWRHVVSWMLLIISWVIVSDRIALWYDANDNTYRNAAVRMHYEETWAFPSMEQWAYWLVQVLELTQEVYGLS